MHIILFDDKSREQLLPLTHTRPIAEIRWGILTMRERWEKLLNQKTGTLTAEYLQNAFPKNTGAENLYINAGFFATAQISQFIRTLGQHEALFQENDLIAVRSQSDFKSFEDLKAFAQQLKVREFNAELLKLEKLWDIFSKNEQAIELDFQLLTQDKTSQPIPEFVNTQNSERIFLEEGAKLNPCFLNPDKGYIYLAKDSEIMEGAMVRGSLALCTHATLKMGAKVYGASTIGPECKIGGEINNVVFFNYSNKGHDGFLGNSVIGDWCNFGADTNCSNLKNNYSEVSIWNEHLNQEEKTGQQFCGLIMADHSKCGINTMFNTGTVVGVSCNIYGGGFPDKFIPSFSWGGSEEVTEYKLEKALQTANKMMSRREKELSKEEIKVLEYIFNHTADQRKANRSELKSN